MELPKSQPFKRKAVLGMIERFRCKYDIRALTIFLCDSGMYLLLMIAVSAIRLKVWELVFVETSLGVVTARLFIVGHDCCHLAFFRSSLVNRVVGRVSFLPSLTPFSTWDVGHNVAHHGFPNLKGRDYVWTPFSPEEFSSLSSGRKALERFYRSLLGLGAYYCIELWWKKLMFPTRKHVGVSRKSHLLDSLFVVVWLALMTLACTTIAHLEGVSELQAVIGGLIFPFAIWNYLMGFVVYVQHTHETIAWYSSRLDWEGVRPQLRNTAEVTFSAPFNWLLHNIMDHHAHHVDVKIPLYSLPAAQAVISHQYPNEILVYKWTWAGFCRTLECCKLYDYSGHQWLNFRGEPTSKAKPMP